MNTTNDNGLAQANHPVTVELGGECVLANTETWRGIADELVAKYGGIPTVTKVEASIDVAKMTYSTFDAGNQIVDAAACTRIESVHSKLQAAGIAVNTSEQLFATGTRMARSGYATQANRRVEHMEKLGIDDVAGQLRDVVLAEKREDVSMSARDLADSIRVNGKITVDGLAFGEQAIRGLLARLDSPALSYVLGLRDRVAELSGKLPEMNKKDPLEALRSRTMMASDKEKIADILRHECLRAPDVELKLRTRREIGDVFAVVSPSYVPADAPSVLEQFVSDLPPDARGTWAYDPTTTTWELRASVWTPTPTEEQAVGEAFEGYVSFRSRDNGTGKFRSGGGETFIRCLNASTYSANTTSGARIHVGRVMHNIAAMTKTGKAAISALCAAWGVAREADLELENEELVGLPISQAIPGLWWGALLDRDCQLAGILPGRSAKHVEGLTAAYVAERRDPARIVKADLGQAWTRYIQDQSAPVRRDAEMAVGNWLMSNRPVKFDATRSS